MLLLPRMAQGTQSPASQAPLLHFPAGEKRQAGSENRLALLGRRRVVHTYHNRHIFAAGTAAWPASTGIGLHRRPRAASSRFAPSLEWQNIGTNGQTDDGPMPRTKSEVLTIRTAAEAERRSAVSMVKVLVLDYVWSAVLDSDRPGRKGSNNAA